MSFEVATPGCGVKSGSWLGSASGMNEVRASAGAPATTTPAPIQSSFKNARLSIELSRNFAEIVSELEPGATVPSELLGLAARHRRKLESRAGKSIGPKNYLRTSRPKPIATSRRFKGGACQELWKPAPRLLEARECVSIRNIEKGDVVGADDLHHSR